MLKFNPPGSGLAPTLPAIKRKNNGVKKTGTVAGTFAVRILICILLSVFILLHFALPSSGPKDAVQWVHSTQNHALRKLHREPSHHFCTQQRTPVVVCAHGGDVLAAPPNTLDAFAAALDAGAGCIEVDASLTQDGILVALHNRDLAELQLSSKSSGSDATYRRILKYVVPPKRALPRVGDYTWPQLKMLRWKDGERVATLRDVLEMAVARGALVTVDVKLREEETEREEAAAMARHLLKDLKASVCGNSCTVWAKSDAVAEALLALDPAQRVGIIAFNAAASAHVKQGQDRVSRLEHLNISIVGAHYAMADPSVAAETRKAGREFHVWTANTPEIMAAALDSAPDAVVTSYPRALLSALEARAVACEDLRGRDEL